MVTKFSTQITDYLKINKLYIELGGIPYQWYTIEKKTVMNFLKI